MRRQKKLPRADVGGIVRVAYWLLVGGCFGVGFMGLLTIGVYFIGVGIVLVAIGIAVPGLRGRCAWLAVSGLGTAPGYVAWLNRDGPGEVCEVTAQSEMCVDEWSPWPFVAAAVILVGVGCLLWLAARRRRGVSVRNVTP